MEIIENGVNVEAFIPKEREGSMRRMVFITVARLTKRKGLQTLLHAFGEAVRMGHRPLELWLVGDGEERSFLQAEAKRLGVDGQVKFLGQVDHEKIAELYQQAQVFVLPSKNEGMSNAVLEALASGLPLVVSGTGGMQEIVEEGKNGFFVNSDDTPSFSEKLLLLAEDSGLREALGKESRRRAEERSWKRVADEFLRVVRV
ncbi:MAG: glycosyltransferase family 4 protein, partial [Candidatus Moraniibacteriota bacterium]